MGAVTFSDLSQDKLERVRSFASLPFENVLHPSREQVESRWIEEISGLLSNDQAVGWLAEVDARICGLALCVPLPWESAILGKTMWTIRYLEAKPPHNHATTSALLDEVIRQMITRGADFLMCKRPTSDSVTVHALEANGFLLMDTLLDFVYDCRKSSSLSDRASQLSDGITLRLATADDVEPLVETARASFTQHFGRFHADPRIGRAAATKVYEEWIRSCALGWADWVYVAMEGKRVAGYSAWKKPSPLDARHGLRLGHYSIGAVHPDFFERGIFKVLTHAGMTKLGSSADWIEGPTHIDNYAVQRGYLRLGWQIVGAEHSFHKWLKD